jgi:arylsulfatase A-like enzyme
VRGPGLEPGRRRAMTTAPDIAPTILELTGLGETPTTMTGDSFGGVLTGTRNEHRPFVVSSWPLYLAEGEIVTAIDSKARRISNYMPLTVTTREKTLILGGPDDEPELYDLMGDPGEQNNAWRELGDEGEALCERTLSFLERVGTPEIYLAPRRQALDRWRRTVRT